ncbi:hypothetical protein U1Q18_010518 [Sarracenia purpurea var. burkii]
MVLLSSFSSVFLVACLQWWAAIGLLLLMLVVCEKCVSRGRAAWVVYCWGTYPLASGAVSLWMCCATSSGSTSSLDELFPLFHACLFLCCSYPSPLLLSLDLALACCHFTRGAVWLVVPCCFWRGDGWE